MTEPVQTLQYKTQILKIVYDECPESPREWDNLGIMICGDRKYTLGDVQIRSKQELDDFRDENDIRIELPINMYEHSGIALSTGNQYPFNDRWDSRQVGIIVATKEKIKDVMGYSKLTNDRREKIIQILKGEVETYSDYLNGNVYGFELYETSKCELNYPHEKLVESCYGFYGYDLKTNGIADSIKDFEKFTEQ